MPSPVVKRRHILRSLVAMPLLAAVSAPARAAEPGIVQRYAPELDAEFWLDAKGEPGEFSMLEQRGKWVYLKCWQSWCPGCHSHGFPALQQITEAFADEPTVVTVAVQTTFEGHWINTADKVRETQLQYALEIPMGHDPGSRNPDGRPNTMRTYRTGGTPWQVLIEPGGRVVFNGFRVNPDAVIEYLHKQIETRGA